MLIMPSNIIIKYCYMQYYSVHCGNIWLSSNQLTARFQNYIIVKIKIILTNKQKLRIKLLISFRNSKLKQWIFHNYMMTRCFTFLIFWHHSTFFHFAKHVCVFIILTIMWNILKLTNIGTSNVKHYGHWWKKMIINI